LSLTTTALPVATSAPAATTPAATTQVQVAAPQPAGTYAGPDGRLYQDPSYYPPSSGGGGGGGIGPPASSGYASAPLLDDGPAAPSSGVGDLFTPRNIAIAAGLFVGGIVVKKLLHA
jgi:hypothetical protein